MREDILRKLHRLRYCVLWPGNWDDIGFTERPIWVNENGYGYYSDDVPCCFMHIEGFTPLFLNQTIEKLNAGILTPDDLTGTPLDHSPFVSVGYIEEESLRGFLHDLSISPFIIKESFFCGEDLDRWRFFDSEESLIDAFKMDYCDGGLRDEMSDDELTIWDSRLFEPGQYFELPIHLSILTNSNSIIPEYVARSSGLSHLPGKSALSIQISGLTGPKPGLPC